LRKAKNAQVKYRKIPKLQIRPKAANSKALRWGIGEAGEPIQTLPCGFYLRALFTRQIFEGAYHGDV